MPGAGTYSSGSGIAGFGPVYQGGRTTAITPRAMRFEGQTKDWVVNSDANFAAVTPNEQAVVLSMSVKKGSIRSSPTTGNTLHEIEYLGASDLGADITNRVMTSQPIARLVSEGAVAIEKIEYQTYTGNGTGPKNRLAVAVWFKDLQSDPNKLKSAQWDT